MFKISAILAIQFSFFASFAMEPAAVAKTVLKRKHDESEVTSTIQPSSKGIRPSLPGDVSKAEVSKIVFKRRHDAVDTGSKAEATAEMQTMPRLASTVVRIEKTEKKEIKESDADALRKPAFIYDAYTQRRGEPKMLVIKCDRCKHRVMSYQKDGPGSLLRCYLDRIHSPEYLHDRQYKYSDTRNLPLLKCDSCRSVIGVPMIYHLENRLAYRMLKDRFYF